MVIIASLFCNVNCNYAFCKRGEEGGGEEGCFASLFSSFCVHGIPTSWRGGGVREDAPKSALWG